MVGANMRTRSGDGSCVASCMRIVLLLALAAGPASRTQTPFVALQGQNASDRSGTSVGHMDMAVCTGLTSHSETMIVAGAPGFGFGMGRLEFWARPTAVVPNWTLFGYTQGIIAAPGVPLGLSLTDARTLTFGF